MMKADKSLSVWMINQYALAPDQAGGTRHYNLAYYLQEQDVEVTILASSLDYSSQREQRLSDGQQSLSQHEQGVKYVWLQTPPYQGNGAGRVKNMLAFLQAVTRWQPEPGTPHPDVIIGSSPHLFSGLAAYLLARRYRVPFVLEIRDIWPKSMTELLGVSPQHPFILTLSALEKFLYQRADLIVGVLQGVGRHASRVAGHSVPFLWLPNGVNLKHYPAEITEPQSNIGTFSVMYTGAHGVPNSLDTALEAARLLQDGGQDHIQFTFVGDGVSKAGMMAWTQQHQLRNVQFADPVPKQEIPYILAQADALLLLQRDVTLYRDGISPNKLFDYFAAAKPVLIALNSPFNAVADAQAGLTIPPEDPQALADALVQLSQTPEAERRAMGARGRAYVQEHHDMRGLAHRLGNALWALAGASGRRQRLRSR